MTEWVVRNHTISCPYQYQTCEGFANAASSQFIAQPEDCFARNSMCVLCFCFLGVLAVARPTSRQMLGRTS
jgi:hypothetical protein